MTDPFGTALATTKGLNQIITPDLQPADVTGSAVFYEGLKLPKSFKVTNAAPTKSLGQSALPAVWIQHFAVSGPKEYGVLRKGLAVGRTIRDLTAVRTTP